jgi:hypothetical protein
MCERDILENCEKEIELDKEDWKGGGGISRSDFLKLFLLELCSN